MTLREMLMRLGGLFNKQRKDRELDEEIESHLQMHIDDNLQRGMTPEEARRQAMIKLGGIESTKEAYRDQRGLPWLEVLWRDIRHGVRQLSKNPGFTAISIITLALGIGANSSMFSLLNALLFRSLPFPEDQNLVRVFRTTEQSRISPHSVPNFRDYREQNQVFEYMTAYSWDTYSLLDGDGSAELLKGLVATSDFFAALRVQPILGRVFTAQESVPNGAKVVVLSESLWRRRFGADSTVIGRSLRLDREIVTVIGVLPDSAEYRPLWGPVDVWRPLVFGADGIYQNRRSNWLMALGRLKPGMSLARAQEEMTGSAQRVAQENPGANKSEGLRLVTLRDSIIDDTTRRLLWLITGLTGLVLLIACANLANLQLARAAARSREFAIRSSLGAGRGRLVSQILVESIVLSLAGAAVGLWIALWSMRFIGRNIILDNERGLAIALDARVILFTFLAALLTAVVFSLAPAWFAARNDVSDVLKAGIRGGTSGRSQKHLRHALIVGEIALAMVLLTGAGLFIRGLEKFFDRDHGWRVDGLVTTQFSLPAPKYADAETKILFFQKLEERLAGLPGVSHAAICWDVPTFRFGSSFSFVVDGQAFPEEGNELQSSIDAVTPDFFRTLGIQLLQGRGFGPGDTAGKPGVAIINEAMAKRFWPNEGALGKRIAAPNAARKGEWLEVVGVVRDVRFPANTAEPDTRLQMYRPLAQQLRQFVTVALRTDSSLDMMAPLLRRSFAEMDREIPLHEITTARMTVDRRNANASLLGALLGAFAVLALILAAVGVYGVISYSVVQRRRELGVRLALGAQVSNVLWLVLRIGLVLAIIGVGIGLFGSLMVSRLIAWTVPELPANDFLTWASVSPILIFVALLACWLPARRAANVDPMVVMRE